MELPCCLIPSRSLDHPLDRRHLVEDLAMYTWGSALASLCFFGTPPPPGVSRGAQNDMAVHLCHSIRRGTAFDLVRESRSSDLVLDTARRLLASESLAPAADWLLERITRLPSEAAEAAFALLNLWGDLSFQIDRRIMPKSWQARREYQRGLLANAEFCRAVFDEASDLFGRLLEALRTHPRDSQVVTINVRFSEFGLGFYPDRESPAGLWQGVPLYEVPWQYGYVPLVATAVRKWPVSRSKHRFINICPPAVERAACQIVLPVAAEHQAPVVAAARGRLAGRAGPSPAEQLGHVRAALTDIVLWHEVGHIWSWQWMGRAASRSGRPDADSVRWTMVEEFYADCRAVRQILQAGDGLARDVFLLYLLENVEPQEKLKPQLPHYRWPVARALAREDGLRYLSSLERTLRRMLGGAPLKSIDQWFERQAEEAVAELKAELLG